MKKIVSLIIAVALVATFLCTAAFAAGTGTVEGNTVSAMPGGTATITVSISGNPGFDAAGLTATAEYPLSVVNVSAGAKMPGGYSNANKVNHFSSELIKGDGVMCTITVKVAEDVTKSGTYPVTVTGYVTDTDVSVASVSGGYVKVEIPEQPTDPQPTDPQPTDPQPTDPQPTDPQPTDPQPTEPQPTDPQPTDPQPTEPQPTDPQPTDPQPTDPQPTDPQPTDPSSEPTDPTTKPTKPSDPTKPTSKDPDEPKNGDITPYPVYFLVAVMAVAAVAFGLKRKFDV